jgi:hypothetical protein
VNFIRSLITQSVAIHMSEETDQFELPEPLAGALRAAYEHRVRIPASVDQAVLSAARAKFAQRRSLRLFVRWGAGIAVGIAAMIVVVVSLHHPAGNAVIAKGDINADGNLNIVDALTLARHIAAGDKLEKAWDINGDGVIDQKDVDALASAAVSLKQMPIVENSLPKLHELGIDHAPRVGFASANGNSPTAYGVGTSANITFAKANPTKNTKEESR